MGQSVHSARWIQQIVDTGWDIHLFDFLEAGVCPEMPHISTYTVHPPPTALTGKIVSHSSYPFRRGAGFVKRRLPEFVQSFFFKPRVSEFVKLYRELQPDIVHSLEMQNESYPLLEAKQILGEKFTAPWVYSSWGSDIYYYQNKPEHRDRIKAVLEACDYHIADCTRDVVLAKDFGFCGETLGVFPVSGCFDVNWARQFIAIDRPSQRRSIALKGYQHEHGRALTALEALRQNAGALSGYTLEVYLPVESVVESARELALTSGVELKILEQTLNVEILKLLGRSRVGLALSISDGTPNTLLEEMIMGAFPVQSDTVSTAEWIDNGVNGLLVPPEDPAATGRAILRALADDDMVDSAADLNKQLMLKRVDKSVNQAKIVQLYEDVYNESRASIRKR